MQEDLYLNYVHELVFLFRKIGAQAESAGTTSGPDGFSEGRGAAYRVVLSLMKSQASVFGLSAEAIGLEGFDPLTDELALPAHLDTREDS